MEEPYRQLDWLVSHKVFISLQLQGAISHSCTKSCQDIQGSLYGQAVISSAWCNDHVVWQADLDASEGVQLEIFHHERALNRADWRWRWC